MDAYVHLVDIDDSHRVGTAMGLTPTGGDDDLSAGLEAEILGDFDGDAVVRPVIGDIGP